MKKFVAVAIAYLAMSPSHAASVITHACHLPPFPVNNVCARGIEGLMVDGVRYDIEFIIQPYHYFEANGLLPFDSGSPQLLAAANAIDDALDAAAALEILAAGTSQDDYYLVAPKNVVGSIFLAYRSTNQAVGDYEANWGNPQPQVISTEDFRIYAAFSVSAVPIPGTAWLLGSALGLLGWVKRNTA